MKKIILGLVILMLSSLVLAGDFNPTTGDMTVTLYKGWNIIPTMSSATDPSGCWTGASWLYYYSGTTKQYVGMSINPQGSYYPNQSTFDSVSQTEYKYPDSMNNPYYGIAQFGGMWVYSNKYCTFTTAFSKPIDIQSQSDQYAQLISNAKLAKGWNFININSWMIGKTLPDIFKNCTVSAMNTWVNSEQHWYYPSSSSTIATTFAEDTSPIYDSGVGTVLVVKVANDCYLNYATDSTGPPALPN